MNASIPVRSARHLSWIRSMPCLVAGCRTGSPVQAHHIRTSANAGTGIKSADSCAVPICADHHAEGHQIGWLTFEERYSLDLAADASRFAASAGSDLSWLF